MIATVERTGSMAAAARELGLVPSALSYRVRQLETALDVLLFDRSSRQAKLTEAGKELLREGNRLLIEIEPGIAFGTGQHATTQLCLRELESIAKEAGQTSLASASLLDVGTGTGILALGASKLGFGRIAGTDIDPDAVLASRNNAAMNGVDLAVTQSTVPSPAAAKNLSSAFQPPFNFVVANILKVVLEKILPDLASALAPGGLLILSGLLHEDAQALTRQAQGLGLFFVRESLQDDWACLVLRLP